MPKYPVLKEWAYAGVVFALTGASASHLLAGNGLGEAAPPLVLVVIAMVSYFLRPPQLRLKS